MLNQLGLTQMLPSAMAIVETINTRFGEIMVDPSRSLVFPRGLLGMPDKANYVVANFPNDKMHQFALLQSLDDHALTFITLPLAFDNAIIAATDLRTACRDMQIAEKNALVLLVVSVHRSLSGVKLSVNARAPLLIDSETKVGVQFVFQNDAYKVQHMLS